MHEGDPVAALGLAHEMGGQEDGDSVLAGEPDEERPEIVACDRVDAGRGLVQDQEFRLVQDRDRQRQALLHAERQGVGELVRGLVQVEALDDVGDAGSTFFGRQPEQAGVQLQVLPDGQLLVEREGLAHVADPAAGLDVLGIDGLAEQRGRALGGGQEAGQHLHGRGLAGPVRAEEAEDLAPLDPHVDMIDRHEVAEALGQAPGLDHRRATGRRPGWQHRRDMVLAPLLGQEADEGLLQTVAARGGQEVAGRVVGQDPAAIHGDQPVELARLVHGGGGHEHRHGRALPADLADKRPELAAGQRVHPGRGLVQDQELRIVDQRAAQAQLLLHAAGQLAGRTVQEREQPRRACQVLDPREILALPLAEQPAEEGQVLRDRQGRIEVLAEPLRHVGDVGADPVPVALLGHGPAEDQDLSRLDPLHACDQRHQGGLADPVRADQPDHLALADRKADAFQRDRPAVAVCYAGKLDDVAGLIKVHRGAAAQDRPARSPHGRPGHRPRRSRRSSHSPRTSPAARGGGAP